MEKKWKNDKKGYHKEYHRKWYLLHKKTVCDKSNKRGEEIRVWFKTYKSQLKCSVCGENHPSCLDFHHNFEKNQCINEMVKNRVGKERILKEIEKCSILCANCHRKFHYDELCKQT